MPSLYMQSFTLVGLVVLISESSLWLWRNTSCLYELTWWSSVISWEDNGLSGSQYFPVFYKTWIWVPAFTRARHMSLSWARYIESIPSHSTFFWYILILSCHLPKKLAQTVKPLICIWKVPVRISTRTPTILTEGFRGFSHSLQRNAGIVPSNDLSPLRATTVPNLSVINNPSIRVYIFWTTDSVTE
jgi:hypothetical protein